MKFQFLNATLLVLTCGGFAVAQAAPDPPATVNQRKENQQDRIAQGVQSGQLTAGETTRLEDKEPALNQEVGADRKANGGSLTPAEKAQVQQQQNGVSKQIYTEKHNTVQAQYGNGVVGQRHNQQDRIAQGIKSGSLTAGQTAKLENKERALNGEIAGDRAANGGRLTKAERAKINRQQNGLSKQIYKKKHVWQGKAEQAQLARSAFERRQLFPLRTCSVQAPAGRPSNAARAASTNALTLRGSLRLAGPPAASKHRRPKDAESRWLRLHSKRLNHPPRSGEPKASQQRRVTNRRSGPNHRHRYLVHRVNSLHTSHLTQPT